MPPLAVNPYKNHAEGVDGICNLLQYGIDCEAIVWNHHEVMYGINPNANEL